MYISNRATFVNDLKNMTISFSKVSDNLISLRLYGDVSSITKSIENINVNYKFIKNSQRFDEQLLW